METDWLIYFGWLFSTVTAVGNGFVIFLVAKNRRLHSSANWLILSLAVADFGVGVVVYPLAYFCRSPTPCNFNLFISFFWLFVNSSVTNLCVLTWDRYAAIVHPLRYNTSMTERHTRTVILAAWLIPLVISLSLFVGLYATKSDTALIVLRLTSVSAFDVISCVLILYAVVRILAVARAQSHQEFATELEEIQSNQSSSETTTSRKHQKHNTASFIIAIVAFFLLCHLAVNGVILWTTFSKNISATVGQVVILLLLINSAVNPFVYAFFKSDIRIEIRKLVGKDERCPEFSSVNV